MFLENDRMARSDYLLPPVRVSSNYQKMCFDIQSTRNSGEWVAGQSAQSQCNNQLVISVIIREKPVGQRQFIIEPFIENGRMARPDYLLLSGDPAKV